MGASAFHLTDIRFAWPGRSGFVLDLPRLEAAQGETVLLLGPSGGGKSTLLGLIAGVVAPQAGRLEVLGRDLAVLTPTARDRFRAERMGVIFQMFNLLPFSSALDNVRLPLAFAPRRRRAAGDPAELLTRLGVGAGLHRARAAELSVGQQQRVAAARALIGAPELVIADEPTSALDAAARDRFMDMLFAQLRADGGALLMVSHDASLAGRFDRVLHLNALLRGEAPC